MRIRLRLQRFGRKKSAFYRLVAASSSCKRDGRFLEIVGLYHPTVRESAQQVRLDEEKIIFWLNKGASPSDTVKKILSGAGIWQKYMLRVNEQKKVSTKKKNQNRKENKALLQSKHQES